MSTERIATDPDKIKAVQEWQKPNSESDLRSFLGLADYYRRYVPSFDQIAKPLHHCLGNTTKSKKASRSSRIVVSFLRKTEQRMYYGIHEVEGATAPVLTYPDFSKPFVVETDASFQGLGEVLSQDHGVVAYASRGLRPAERNYANYSSIKLKLLDLKWAITDKFRYYLIGSPCIIYTDNNPLSYIQTSKLGATELGWVAQLAHLISALSTVAVD